MSSFSIEFKVITSVLQPRVEEYGDHSMHKHDNWRQKWLILLYLWDTDPFSSTVCMCK